VIEEAPSPLLDEATRDRIGRAACAVAESVDYVGAGTVEFLVSDASPGEFFFMEMNTRLQVEHPVTELVTGLDLVEWQLRIAAGEPLTLVQDDVRLSGHAVEARVYAENPERSFLPSDGTVLALHEPSGAGVRVDSGLQAGNAIVTEYDPMLSKIIAWGEDRRTALARLDAALADTAILGAVTNVHWLRTLLADPDVQSGRLDTTLIDRRFSDLEPTEPSANDLATAALLVHFDRCAERAGSAGPLWSAPSGWRLGSNRPVAYDLDTAVVQLSGDADALATATAQVTVPGVPALRGGVRVSRPVAPGEPSTAHVTLDGVTRSVPFARSAGSNGGPAAVWLGDGGAVREVRILDRPTRLARELAGLTRVAGAADPDLRSPMPGTVVAVAVSSGDEVDAGDTVLTVEAMKMEHRLVAPVAGRVHVRVAPGDLVRLDQVVATVVATVEAGPSPSAEPAAAAADAQADHHPVPPTTVEHQAATPTRSTVA
jgi:acetyl-CoA/propionyl-CoA carboxylase biotin carboxyl carrier protein